jgi:outer membrane receptor protein involved in Fe transport
MFMDRICAAPAASVTARQTARLISTLVFVLTLLLLPGTLTRAFAAPPAGTIEGIAKDALERPLAGAGVRLEAPDGSVVARTTTDDTGRYRFTAIPAGIYSVVAEKAGFDTATAIASLDASTGATADLTLASQQALDMRVVAQRLAEARLAIQPRIGATTYTLTDKAIENQPGGENNSLQQVVLQAPGVTADSLAQGQIHVRNEHSNVQYRINGVILPDGVTGFGQTLSPRFASSIDLITGALPAEYGLRTAGIIDIQTKSGAFTPGGSIGIYGGSHGLIQPSLEYAGSVGHYNYFFAGDYLQSHLGLENPTGSYNPIHDDTKQGHGFAYLEDILDSTSKVSLILGTFQGHFQIPNIPGQTPPGLGTGGAPITVNGVSTFDSAKLNETQREIAHYGVLSYLKSQQDYTFQVAAFAKYSSLTFRPDPLGDLIFNGIAQNAYRRSIASGLQAEGSYKLTPDHTLRSGLIVTGERTTSQTTSLVVPTDPVTGNQSGSPFLIPDSGAKTGWTYSAYLQDEWRVLPTVTVNYGGRFDVVDAFTHENQISPRLNAVWQATPTTTLHAGYARYFTPPPFELVSITNVGNLQNTSGAPPGTGNATVKAERADYFDIGASQQIIPGLKVGVDVYYKHSHNLIDEGQFGSPIILTPFNYRSAWNRGVEITTTYDNGPFSFYGNLAIAQQKAKDIVSSQFNFSPDDLAYIAAHAINTDHAQLLTASAGASYLWRSTRFSVNVIAGSGLRSSPAGIPNNGSLPSYEQVNLGVSHRFESAPGGPLEIRFDVINLLDEVYKIRDGTGVGIGAPQFGPRRSFFAGIKKEF